MTTSKQELLAQALREYPTWGHAFLAERERNIELKKLLREWREMADLPSGGYGGTLKHRTDEALK
jgi:hypothetical protein